MPEYDKTAAAAVSAAGQAYNADQTRRTNEANRAYSDRQYQRERRDALSDWERNARYNSPEQQMERLRQAGLNPNLIYGKGAQNTIQSIRASSSKQVSAIAPKINSDAPLGALSMYSSMQKTQAETDNLDEQNAVLTAEAILKGAQTAGKTAETAQTKFQLKQAQELNDSVIKRAKIENAMREAQTEHEKVKKGLTTQQTLTEKQKTLQVKSLIKLTKTDTRLKAEHLKLAKEGVYPSDELWLRLMIKQAKKLGLKLKIPKSPTGESPWERLKKTYKF